MIRRTLTIALALLALALPAYAATTFEYLFTGGYPLAISDDGTVIAGSEKGSAAVFRWSRTDGYQSLGMGVPSGSIGLSADGSRIAGSIKSPDSTYTTQGLWTQSGGWQYIMPPIPPGVAVLDQELATVGSMSGDGSTVVGLLWRTDGKGHASAWTQDTGVLDLGATGNGGRAIATNFDGSVIVGFDDDPTYGYRCPAVWDHGQLHVLEPGVNGEVWSSNQNGDVIGGFVEDSLQYRQAAIWHRVGGVWQHAQKLGVIPGTDIAPALNRIMGLSADGTLGVGFCTYEGDPFYTTGIVWSNTDGLMDVVQYLGNQGILPDPSFTIYTLTCMTPDGTKLVGYGSDTVAPYTLRAFMIHLDRAAVGVPRGVTPASRALSASPNPLSTASTLSFSLSAATTGSLTIHDSAGRLVRTLASGTMTAGPHSIAWDGRDESGTRLPAGVYFTQLVAGSHREMGKLVLVK